MFRKAIAAVALVCALAAPAALADQHESPSLEPVAAIFAQQPVKVTCATPSEDGLFYIAWGYVFLSQPEIHMNTYLCDAVEHLTDPSYGLSVRGLALMVLVHESYHLRLNLSDRGDEARTQCRAIRHVRYAAIMMGASPELATQLRAYALVWHWHLAARFPEYSLKGCKVPRP